MTKFKNLLGLSALGLILAGPAFAGTLTYNATVANQSTDLTNVAFSPSISEYNGAQTLLSVEVIYQGTGNTTITASNGANTSESFTGVTSSQFSLNMIGVASGSLFTLQGSTGSQTLAAHTGASYGPISFTNSADYDHTFTDATTLGLFTGSGTVSASMSTLTGISALGGGGNITIGQTTVAGGTLEVIYTYGTNVPEPISIALLGTGLLGLGAVRFRRRR